MSTALVDVVVPTIGRPQLTALLDDLAAATGGACPHVVVVDDRPPAGPPILPRPTRAFPGIEVRRSHGRGPAAARNVGWSGGTSEWVVFLDDDVRLPPEWYRTLCADLLDAPPWIGGIQGRVTVPLPGDRRPTDWERNVKRLERAAWATADMAYRRSALEAVGGFDERFPRAYREDADLALQIEAAGYGLWRGRRHVRHPVRPASPWVSVANQRGNADDALLRARYGRSWRRRIGAGGRLGRHLLVVAAASGAAFGLALGRRRAGVACAAFASVGVLELGAARLRHGLTTRGDLVAVLVTTPLLPFTAVAHRVRGELTVRRRARRGVPPSTRLGVRWPVPRALLFDRDGTLVCDVPYNGDADLVVAVPGAARAVARARRAGVHVGVVTNQSGVARGVLRPSDVAAVNARVDELLGPFEVWMVCPHGPEARCRCRKPAPGMILRAARHLRVDPALCVVVGDTGADVDAARAAGARGVLVPNAVTRPEEIAEATEVATSVEHAVDLVLVR